MLLLLIIVPKVGGGRFTGAALQTAQVVEFYYTPTMDVTSRCVKTKSERVERSIFESSSNAAHRTTQKLALFQKLDADIFRNSISPTLFEHVKKQQHQEDVEQRQKQQLHQQQLVQQKQKQPRQKPLVVPHR